MIKVILLSLLPLFSVVCFAQETKHDRKDKVVEITGVISLPATSWSPGGFDGECFNPLPRIELSDKTYYLLNTCSIPDNMLGKEVIIKGTIEEKEIEDPKLRKKLIIPFIRVKDIKSNSNN